MNLKIMRVNPEEIKRGDYVFLQGEICFVLYCGETWIHKHPYIYCSYATRSNGEEHKDICISNMPKRVEICRAVKE